MCDCRLVNVTFAVELKPVVLTLGAVVRKNGHVIPYNTRLRATSFVLHAKLADDGPVDTVSVVRIGALTSSLELVMLPVTI